MRSLSAPAGIATVPVVYLAARWLAGRRAAAITGLLVAVSPAMVWFSQEARAYAAGDVAVGADRVMCRRVMQFRAVHAGLSGGRHPPRSAWRPTTSSRSSCSANSCGCGGRLPRDRRLAAAFGLVAARRLALLPLAITQQQTGHADYISHSTLHTTFVQIPKQLLLGYASPRQHVTVVLAALLLLVGAVAPLALSAPVRARAAWPLATGAVAALVPVLLAACGADLDARNLLPALPPLAIAAGIGFSGWEELAADSRRPGWRRSAAGLRSDWR